MTAPRLMRVAAVQVVSGVDTASSSHVTLTFDQAMALPTAPDAVSFDGGIRPLAIMSVPGQTSRFTVQVTEQTQNQLYRVFVSSGVMSGGGEYVNASFDNMEFVGYGAQPLYVVHELVSCPSAEGRKISLFWSDPESGAPQTVTIIRRTGTWPTFPAEDGGVVVFNGLPSGLPSNPNKDDSRRYFLDTGLVADVFYYYVVLVSESPGAAIAAMSYSPNCQTYELSIGELPEAAAYLESQGMVPSIFLEDDAPHQVLKPFVEMLGGAVSLLRGQAMATLLQSDPLRCPHPFLADRCRAMGFEPEGDSYDLDTHRRLVAGIVPVLARKGMTAAIVDLAHLLTLWAVEVVQFGIGARAKYLSTFGGMVSMGEYNPTAAYSGYTMTDQGRSPWFVDSWVGGTMRDSFGNLLEVKSNGSTSLTFVPEDSWDKITFSGTLNSSTQSAVVSSVEGLKVGQRVHLRNTANDAAEVIQLTYIDGSTKVVRWWNRLQGSYAGATSFISWRITRPCPALVGNCATNGSELIGVGDMDSLQWTVDQWVGFQVRDAGGTVRNVVSNTETTITTDGGGNPPLGLFMLAKTFDGLNPMTDYIVTLEPYSTLYDPLYDLALRGTRFDPYSYIFTPGILTGRLNGHPGPCSIGVYVRSPEAVTAKGKWSSANTSEITDTNQNFVNDALVGLYLNPNQGQTRFFPIISNTATKITVAGDISGLVVENQPYFVMTGRNVARYQALVRRLPELVEDGNSIQILFI